MKKWERILLDLRDWIVPILEKNPENHKDKGTNKQLPQWSQNEYANCAKTWYELLKDKYQQEDDHRKNIDARLQPFLGLIPVGATLLLGIISNFLFKDLKEYPKLLILPLYCGCLYVVFQLLVALFHTFKGLSLRAYDIIEDIFPEKNETNEQFFFRLSQELIKISWHNSKQNNDKASYLRCVHISLRNTIVGFAIVTLILVGIGIRGLFL